MRNEQVEWSCSICTRLRYPVDFVTEKDTKSINRDNGKLKKVITSQPGV